MIRDPGHRARLQATGCAEIGAVGPDVLAAARAALSALLPAAREDLHFSSASPDVGYRAAVSEAVGRIVAPAVGRLLADDAEFLFGVVIAQRAGGGGMGFHHDLSFTDPEDGRALVVWVALSDVDDERGTLSYLPGSHRLVAGPRGTPSFPSPLRDLPADLLEDRFRSVDAPAGTVVVTDPRLAHRSTANRSTGDRLTAVLVFLPREAELVHHHLRADGMVERFAADPRFYTRFDLHERPTGLRSLGTFAPRFPAVDRATFEAAVPAAGSAGGAPR